MLFLTKWQKILKSLQLPSTAIQNKGSERFAIVPLPSPPVLRGRGVGGEGEKGQAPRVGLGAAPSPPTPLPRSTGGEGRKAQFGPSILKRLYQGNYFPGGARFCACRQALTTALASVSRRWAVAREIPSCFPISSSEQPSSARWRRVAPSRPTLAATVRSRKSRRSAVSTSANPWPALRSRSCLEEKATSPRRVSLRWAFSTLAAPV